MKFNELLKNLEKILKLRELKDQYTGISDPEYEEHRRDDIEDSVGGVVKFPAEPVGVGNIKTFEKSCDKRIYLFSDGSVRTKKVKEFSYVDQNGFVNIIPIILGQIGMAIVDTQSHPQTTYQETRFLILAPFRLLYTEKEYKRLLNEFGAEYDQNCVFKLASIPLENLGYNRPKVKLEKLDLIDNTIGTDKDKLPIQTGSGTCAWYDLSNPEVTLERLRSLSSRKAKYHMNKLEWEGIVNFLKSYLSSNRGTLEKYSLAKDGTLLDIIKSRPSAIGYLEYLVGISKSFSLRPIYEIRQKYGIRMMKILRDLKEGQRTRAFVLDIDGDYVVFWYMRLREPRGHNSNLVSIGDKFNGIVKVEIYIPEVDKLKEEGRLDQSMTQMYNEISARIYNSRFPIPYRDQRWLSSLYPTFLCEEVIKSAFLSNFSLAQILENIFRRL